MKLNMKSKLTFSLLLLTVFITEASNEPLKKQLEKVNVFWSEHALEKKLLNVTKTELSDNELIQTHLQLVETSLRKNTPTNLTHKQLKKRLQLLDTLSSYWRRGRFPKNTGHFVRIPYFIDEFGTACAVGQLIISSGHAKLSRKISCENNNSYIAELDIKYPEISSWAQQHGFEMRELKWIQPCYPPPPDTAGLRHPICHNSYDGYFAPDISALQGPFTKSFFVKVNNGWSPYVTMCGYPMFYLASPGIYKWEVKDYANVIHTFTAELTSPPAASVTISKSGNFDTCNGMVSVSVQGGVLPFSYLWYGQPGNTATLTSVCNKELYLTFSEATNKCSQYFNIIEKPTNIEESGAEELLPFQNPVSDIIPLRSKTLLKTIKIIDSHGQLFLQRDVQSSSYDVDFSRAPVGIYFLQLDNYKPQRFVKQ